MVKVNELVMAFSKDIMDIVRSVMSSNLLINKKVGRNTIAPDSDIFKNLQVQSTNDGDLVFDIMLNDYLVYIENGRRKGAKMPPIEPIIEWARKHGIPTDNSTIFLIRRAISRDGIAARPFMANVIEEIDTTWNNRWADELFNKIMEEVDKFFS